MLSKNKDSFIQEYNGKITWNVSGFGSMFHMRYINSLISIWENLGVKETFPINFIHGAFCSRFNGGRESLSFATKDEIQKYVEFYNSKNIGVRMTLSNTTISKDDFKDSYLNFLLTTLNNGNNNGVICVVDDFAKYIKDTYPNLYLTASMVKTEVETKLGDTDTPDYYNSVCEKGLYDEVVINTARALDSDFIDMLKYPEKIEIIVNHACTANCPVAGLHHKLIEKLDAIKSCCMEKNKIYTDDSEFKVVDKQLKKLLEQCDKNHLANNINSLRLQNLNKEEINYLISKGITHFKLEGRDLALFEMYLYLNIYVFNQESYFKQCNCNDDYQKLINSDM